MHAPLICKQLGDDLGSAEQRRRHRAQRSGSRSGPLCCSKATTAMLGRKLLPNCRHGGERTCWASRSAAPSSSSSSSRSCSYRREITHCLAPAGSCWCAMARAKARPAAGGGGRAWQAWAEERRGADRELVDGRARELQA